MATASPLLFAETLNSPGLWKALGKTHGLTEKDFRWLAHVALATHTLRSAQTPSMLAEGIVLNAATLDPVPLAGAFTLSATPDEKAHILYTPYDGIRKFDSRASLKSALETQIKTASEDDNLLAFMAMAQRRSLLEAGGISVSFKTIEGDVFESQKAVILQARQTEAQAMLNELNKLPSLTALLDQILDDLLKPPSGKHSHRPTQVSFYTPASENSEATQASSRNWHNSMSLSDTVLMLYRHPHWPAEHKREFSNPGQSLDNEDQTEWENAVSHAASMLQALLFKQMETYWDTASADGATRRTFFSQALASQARTELLLKREADIITAEQFNNLHFIVQQIAGGRRPTLETVHVWEHAANYIEPAGSLMIDDTRAFLYTPSSGLQVLADYQDLQRTVLAKFASAGHEDEMYALLSLEERARFLGFDKPNVSGEPIAGEIFTVLFEAIITKQRQNIEYALQVFRHSDGVVQVHALFDKALDIRAMIHERLLELESDGRWTTRPVLSGNQQPSAVQADTAAEAIKTYESVQSVFNEAFSAQPVATEAEQRTYLESIQASWVNALSVGLRGEARFRRVQGSLSATDLAMVASVFASEDHSRNERKVINGFRPDVFSLTLEAPGETRLLPLASCFLLTERGGLDDRHSGRAIVWTPAMGLEPFANLGLARQALKTRLEDSTRRGLLLENLSPAQWRFHLNYTLGPFRLIEGSPLRNRVASAIEQFLARGNKVRSRIKDKTRQASALKKLSATADATNLVQAISLCHAVNQQQTLPAWLGMAPIKEQQRHLELLQQWHNSASDDKDYLDNVADLTSHVNQRLKTLLDERFPNSKLDPQDIRITPNLALAGPARSLTGFALNHVNVAQGTGFKITSKTSQVIPTALDQQAVKQLLLSLDVSSTYAAKVSKTLTDDTARKQRFIRQLPWQLLQHAHSLKLQGALSDNAFEHISQVLDMPDGSARASVTGAHAVISPLSLIKTVGATAVKALGLYVLSPGSGQKGPTVLYAPYFDTVFQEFETPARLISALNTPGPLQSLLLRRLPSAQQAVFRSLLQSSVGETSEMTLDPQPISGHLLEHLFSDNTNLLKQFLGCQTLTDAQADWETAKNLFGDGFKRVTGVLPGKLAYVPFLWQAYKDFEDSAENLQAHHWRRALRSFIEGAVQMVTAGRLSLEDSPVSHSADEPQTTAPDEKTPAAAEPTFAPAWKDIQLTSSLRTSLQRYEATTVALKDLVHDAAKATYLDSASQNTYAAIDGKALRIKNDGATWRLFDGEHYGHALRKKDTSLVLDRSARTIRFGKALSKLNRREAPDFTTSMLLNIEAQGMKEIRRKHPLKAWMLVQAIDLARYYAFNSLHNLAQLKNKVANTRLEAFLKSFFGVKAIDADLLGKIHETIVPICNALVDPTEDLMNTDRFVVGSNKYPHSDMTAFVLDDDAEKKVHFTERFFDQRLDWYKSGMTEPFNVEGHAQAALLIHEFAHQVSKAEDIVMLEARRPFADLISTQTTTGKLLKQAQEDHQHHVLSLTTPREQLFRLWSSEDHAWVGLDQIDGLSEAAACKGILKATSSTTLTEARNAFLDQNTSDARVNTILLNADSVAMLICMMGRKLDL